MFWKNIKNRLEINGRPGIFGLKMSLCCPLGVEQWLQQLDFPIGHNGTCSHCFVHACIISLMLCYKSIAFIHKLAASQVGTASTAMKVCYYFEHSPMLAIMLTSL